MATFVATSGPPPTAPTGAMSNHLVMSTSSYHHHRHHKSNFYSQGFSPTSSSLSFSINSRENSPPKMASTIAVSSSTSTVQRKISRGESIHSGHFMVSEIDETESEQQQQPPSLSGSSKKSPETDQSDYEGNNNIDEALEGNRLLSTGGVSGFHADFQPVSNENSQLSNSHFYTGSGGVVRSAVGGSVSVQFDSSLTKLFESMRLAYSGKITSPKWKAFKGLKLHIKDKIRLNNIIWRAWHIQYIAGRNPVVCQFSSSADSKRHKRTEAILLEGKYWKRRVDAVQEEYKKWRTYHRKGHGPQTPSRPSDFDWELSLPRWSNNLSNLDSLFSCEESGDFFSPNYINAQNSFGNYYDYNSREIARSGMGAQFMQPGLEQLQPNVDFMDTFEPLHEAISRYHNNFALPTVQEESTAFDANSKEQEDLFNSLFPPQNTSDASSVVQQQQMGSSNVLNKPMMETEENVSSYSTSSLFQTHNDQMLNNMNATLKQQQQQQSILDNSILMHQQQQQQQSQINYGDVLGKLDLSSNNFTFHQSNNQQQGLNMITSLPAGQQQSSMGMQQQQFSSNSNLMSISNSTTIRTGNDQQQQQQTLPSSFLSRYQVQAEQTQQPQGTSVNIFQPEPGMLTMGYGDQSSAADKNTIGKGKYFTSSYYSGPANIGSGGTGRSRSRSISMPHAKPVVQNNTSASTIKSLLTKPSLVSSMGPGAESSSSGNSTQLITSSSTFRVPTASECLSSSSTSANAQAIRSNNHSHSGSMERSISLPVYSQERHRKLGIGGAHGAQIGSSSGSMMLLQRLQQQQQQNSNSASLFEISSAGGAFLSGGNQQQQQLSTTTVGASSTFFPAAMNTTNNNNGSGSTSSLMTSSQQQQQYSNQETQQQQQLLLPQQTNSNSQQQQQQQQMPQIRKVSQTSVDYIGKLSDVGFPPQFGGSGPLSFGGSNPNLMSNLMAVNAVSQGQTSGGLSVGFSSHHATSNSSSSSSPIGSLQDAGKMNITFSGGNGSPLTFTLGGSTANQQQQQAFLNSQHQQLQHQQQQQHQQLQQQSSSPFGLLNKSASSRFKSSSLTDFKDHSQLELSSGGGGKVTGSRSLAKKPANLFGSVDFSTSSTDPPLTLSPRDTTFSFRSPFTSPHPPSSPANAPAGSLSPVSPSSSSSALLGSFVSGKGEDRVLYKERRRVCHINAEQKRRCNIKNGFDTLRNLLPSLSSNTNTKVSKAAMLQKAAEYIRQLESEKYDQEKEYEALKQKVESLNQTISVFQNQLPATGAPVMGQRSSQIKEQYAEYVHSRTMVNWKFWVFSIIMESLLDSYCNTVATSNYEEMCKTLLRWLDQSCCLITLRRDVSNSLRFISTSTNILTSPEALPEEALLAVTASKGGVGGGKGTGNSSSSKEVEEVERVRKYSNR